MPNSSKIEFRLSYTLDDRELQLEVYPKRSVTDEILIESVIPYLNQHPEIISLDISNQQITVKGAEALAKHTTLRTLNLSENFELGDEGIAAIAANTTLRLLNLSSTEMNDLGANALATNQTLLLLDISDNHITDIGAITLANNKTLLFLDISQNKITEKGAKAFANNTSIKHLKINNNDISPELQSALTEENPVKRSNQRRKLGLEQGTDIPSLYQQSIFNLTKMINKGEISDIEILLPDDINDHMASTKIKGKNKINKHKNFNYSILFEDKNNYLRLVSRKKNITDEILIQFIIPFLKAHPEISSLDISENNIGENGAKALAQITTLKELNIRHNNIGDIGAIAFAKNSNLTSLDIGENKISKNGVAEFAHSNTLISLDVSYNKIGDEGARELAKNTMLTTLYLRGCKIGPEGAKELAKNVALRSLDLSFNLIMDEGAIAIAANTTLERLDVFSNKINRLGSEALAENSAFMRGKENKNASRKPNVPLLFSGNTNKTNKPIDEFNNNSQNQDRPKTPNK